jgi:hypothetical protein
MARCDRNCGVKVIREDLSTNQFHNWGHFGELGLSADWDNKAEMSLTLVWTKFAHPKCILPRFVRSRAAHRTYDNIRTNLCIVYNLLRPIPTIIFCNVDTRSGPLFNPEGQTSFSPTYSHISCVPITLNAALISIAGQLRYDSTTGSIPLTLSEQCH